MMSTRFALNAPRSIDAARALVLRGEIEAFNADYCATLDANDIESWPNYFVEDGLYRVTGRENADLGLPVGLVYAEGRDMMHDRAVAIAINGWLQGAAAGDGLQFGGLLFARLGRQGIDLVQRQDFLLVAQALAVGVELSPDDAIGLDDVVLGPVDQVDKRGRALDVA